jgi:hypothetical protein
VAVLEVLLSPETGTAVVDDMDDREHLPTPAAGGAAPCRSGAILPPPERRSRAALLASDQE